ncbi:MAG: hypothetical protein MUP49_07015 [Dehalococcoidia bacterium]|nr:hypothetical protein [Dehalococcoidia bacterium]
MRLKPHPFPLGERIEVMVESDKVGLYCYSMYVIVAVLKSELTAFNKKRKVIRSIPFNRWSRKRVLRLFSLDHMLSVC